MIILTEHLGVTYGQQLAVFPNEANLGKRWQYTAGQLRKQWQQEEARRVAEASQADGADSQDES